MVVASFFFALSVVHAQDSSSYSFIAAGHAYGSHDGDNIGLHPPLLERLYSGIDSTVEFIVFTGDIVNHSTVDSWQQVELEMNGIGLPSYYVMGNHDNNELGRAVFEEKHGGTFYSFYSHGDLFVVLNSIEADRAISEQQLVFLQDQIDQAGDSTRNIFIFFHEILWNSHEKYLGVRSNSRSRYDQVVEYSNYWEELHPMLMENPDKYFYLLAGDVGGNPDAISAFYDRWDHITFLASGMGEVADENYLMVHVFEGDSTDFELVPLNAELSLPAIEFYSVPQVPASILGPDFVFQGSRSVEYLASRVFNADSYGWILPPGASGSSATDRIDVDFDENFTSGELSVRASRDGFGSSAATSIPVQADYTSIEASEGEKPAPLIKVRNNGSFLVVECTEVRGELVYIQIMDPVGKILFSKRFIPGDLHEFSINTADIPHGVLFIWAGTATRQITEKIIIR